MNFCQGCYRILIGLMNDYEIIYFQSFFVILIYQIRLSEMVNDFLLEFGDCLLCWIIVYFQYFKTDYQQSGLYFLLIESLQEIIYKLNYSLCRHLVP